MSVAFDAVSSAIDNNTSSTSFSWTHTPAGTPTAVGVSLENYEGSATVSSITYGGTSMTKQITVTNTTSNNSAQVWGLANPPSGAQTVTVNLSSGTASAFTQAGAITVTGSDTTTCFRNSNSATGNSGTPSVVVTTTSGDFVIDVMAGETSMATPWSVGGSQTLRWGPSDAPGNRAAGSSAPAAASSTTMSWSFTSGTDNWAMAAASFKAAPVSSPFIYNDFPNPRFNAWNPMLITWLDMGNTVLPSQSALVLMGQIML